MRNTLSLLILLLAAFMAEAQKTTIVADSLTHTPLPNASVSGRGGKTIGFSDSRGRLPHIAPDSFPLTISYMGYNSREVHNLNVDTVFLSEKINELPEVVFESRADRYLHILAYVREYSTMSTYTDTVFLFREKMVDFMLPPEKKIKYQGWTKPRVLTSKSYYRFTNDAGLDSVSDASNHHFSWSDWMGVAPLTFMPGSLRGLDYGSDTICARYGIAEIWEKKSDKVSVGINVLADTAERRWVPELSGFFRKDVDFEVLKIRLGYEDVVGDSVAPMDLARYSFNIQSNGRGHDMFRFNRLNEPYFVTTEADVYLLDREYVTLKEARKWESRKFDLDEIGIFEPMDAPALPPDVEALMARVDNLDIEQIRLQEVKPDYRLLSRYRGNYKIGHRALSLLKQLTGITLYKSHRNMNRRWDDFSTRQKQNNNKKKDRK